jgi:hypothetical protein
MWGGELQASKWTSGGESIHHITREMDGTTCAGGAGWTFLAEKAAFGFNRQERNELFENATFEQ